MAKATVKPKRAVKARGAPRIARGAPTATETPTPPTQPQATAPAPAAPAVVAEVNGDSTGSSQATPGMTELHTEHNQLSGEIHSMLADLHGRVMASEPGEDAEADDVNLRISTVIGELCARQETLATRQEELHAMAQLVGTPVSTPVGVRLGDNSPYGSEPIVFGEGIAGRDYHAQFNVFARGEQRGDFSGALNFIQSAAAADPMITGSNPDGGYFVPTVMADRIDRIIDKRSRFATLAQVIPMNVGNAWEKMVTTGKPDVEHVGEQTERGETKGVEYENLKIEVIKVAAKPRISEDALEDPQFDLGMNLIDELGMAYSRDMGDGFINGNGGNYARGVLGNTYEWVDNDDWEWGKLGQVKTGVADDFPKNNDAKNPWEPLVECLAAMDEGYEAGTSWVLNRKTEAKLRMMVNKDKDMVWQPSVLLGTPNTILNHPTVIDANMPDIGAGKRPILLASPGGYVVLRRRNLTVIRDNITLPGWVKFITSMRYGGGVAQYEKIKGVLIGA